MPSFTQISRLVILVLAGMALTAFVDLPTWTLPLIVLDSPLTLHVSGPWFIAAGLVILVCTGTDILLRLRPELGEIKFHHSAPAWILPSMLAAAGPVLIAGFEPLSTRWFLVLAGIGVGLSLALLAEFHLADPDDRYFRAASAGLTVLIYAVALLMFTGIYSTHTRTALSGTAIVLASFLLAVSLFRFSTSRGGLRWPYAILTAFIVGLVTWQLNHMSLDGLTGGGLLLLVFYLTTGVIQQFIRQELNRRILIEFVVAAMVGLLLLIGFGLR